MATNTIPNYGRFVDADSLTVAGKVQKLRLHQIATSELRENHA
jgi:hypothetical protein